MHKPPQETTGRGLLLFAALMLALALWISVGRGEWLASGMWFALAIFFACYGSIMNGALERWRTILLALGLAGGITALGYAIWMAGLHS